MKNSINKLLGIICYPFGGMEYYHKDYFKELCNVYLKSDQEGMKAANSSLYADLERNLSRYSVMNSYDEIRLLFNRYYKNKMQKSGNIPNEGWRLCVSIYENCLKAIATAFISQRDGKVVYKYWRNEWDEKLLGGFSEEDKILLFHALTKRIPTDMVAAQFLLDTKMHIADSRERYQQVRDACSYDGQINIADLQLDDILERGVAENHLHLGAATSFSFLWELLMKRPETGCKGNYHNLFKNFTDRTGQKDFPEYLLAAGLMRAVFLIYIRDYGIYGSRDRENNLMWYWHQKSEEIYNILVCIYQGESFRQLEPGPENIENSAFFAGIIGIWEELTGRFTDFAAESKDIIRSLLEKEYGIVLEAETVFLYRVMEHLQGYGREDRGFQIIFWQYIRIKSETYHLWVQDNSIRGLDYFDIFYNSNSQALNLGADFWGNVMRSQFANEALKKVEFRTTLSVSESVVRGWLKQFFRSYLKLVKENYCKYYPESGKYELVKEFPRAGIIYHFIKKKDNTMPEKCWMDFREGDVCMKSDRLSFYHVQKEYLLQVENLKKLRRENPVVSHYIVGLDAASAENNTPVWVFAPVYEAARDSREEGLSADMYGGRRSTVQSLRFTFHAGEEFRHILSGIRRIDEVIEYCKFHAGDRIGHGVALGIDVEEWARLNPMAVLPRVEILDNLLWVWKIFSEEIHDASNVQFYIEQEIFRLAKNIYGNLDGITIPLLLEAYKKLFQPIENHVEGCRIFEIDEYNEKGQVFCQYVEKQYTISWNVQKLLASRHCKKYLQKMEEPVYYKVSRQEIEIAREVQQIIRKKVSHLGIVIEVNPSSNTGITQADTIFKNQAFILNGLLFGKENIMICVNTDNPSCCSTNINNELAYLYYGMLANGKSREDALFWIDKIRRIGLDASFIKGMRPGNIVLEELEQIVAGFE